MTVEFPEATAIDRLLALLEEALPGVVVLDGPVISTPSAQLFVTVGGRLLEPSPTESDLDWAAIGRTRLEDTFRIPCLVMAWGGSARFAPHRAAVFQTLGAAATAIASNPTLDGLVRWARVDAPELLQIRSSKGTRAELSFDVLCTKRIG